MMLHKYENNPILSPNPEREWEALVTTNPGVWYDEENSEFVMLYRAAGNDEEHHINLGLAKSKDGFHFERCSEKPLMPTYDGAWDEGSIEDPRIIKMKDFYYITYATVPHCPGRYWTLKPDERHVPDVDENAPFILRRNQTRTGLAITKDFQKIYRPGYLTDPMVDDRDVVIFPEKVNGKFVTLHRPMSWTGEQYGTEHPAIWIAFSDDLLEHKQLTLLAKAKYDWEEKVGGSAPPIKTEYGWFMLYHAVGKDKKYRVGAMLLDLNDPTVVLARTRKPILVPEYEFENEGIYKGICFPCGNAVKDGTLFVYYGAADQYVGVATCDFEKLLVDLMEQKGQ